MTIPSWASSVDLVIAPYFDTLDEPDETVFVTLASRSHYVIGSPISAFVMVLNAGTPRADIDTDSDNSGTVDRTQAEEDVEMTAPGKGLRLNDNDDNENGKPDKDEVGLFVNAQGLPQDDNDLQPISLSFNAAGNSLTGHTLTLSKSNENIKLWADKQKLALPWMTFATGGVPGTIYVEGFAAGTSTVSWTLKKPDGTVVDQDSVLFTVVKLDLTAYRPNTTPFKPVAVPETQEENPGVGIRRNGDDDNGNNISDLSETPTNSVTGENDLIEVRTSGVFTQGVKYVLKRSNSNINVWANNDRSTPILRTNDSWEFNLFNTPKFVEWATMNTAATSAELILEARTTTNDPATNDRLIYSDKIKFVPFQTMVIVLGGEGQVPTDPVTQPANYGIFQFAIEQYRNGYNVYMYDEDVVESDGSSDATHGGYDEVVKAIQRRGITKVVIIGYSHGGGSNQFQNL